MEYVNDQLLTHHCNNDIKGKISPVENLITDENTPKKRLIQRIEDIMEVASIYSFSAENILDTSNDTVLLEQSLKESNFVFMTPTQRNVTGTPGRKLFHDNITRNSLFECSNSIDSLKNSCKTKNKFISLLKCLNDRHFNKSPGKLLPQSFKNVSHCYNIEREYYECNFKEGDFIIPKDESNHIFEDGKLNTKKYTLNINLFQFS